MNEIIITTVSDNFTAEYDRTRGMYKVTIFNDNQQLYEIWFDAYEEKEVTNKTKLIGQMQQFKENMMHMMGTHKYLSANLFGKVMDKIIEVIDQMA